MWKKHFKEFDTKLEICEFDEAEINNCIKQYCDGGEEKAKKMTAITLCCHKPDICSVVAEGLSLVPDTSDSTASQPRTITQLTTILMRRIISKSRLTSETKTHSYKKLARIAEWRMKTKPFSLTFTSQDLLKDTGLEVTEDDLQLGLLYTPKVPSPLLENTTIKLFSFISSPILKYLAAWHLVSLPEREAQDILDGVRNWQYDILTIFLLSLLGDDSLQAHLADGMPELRE